MVYFWLAISLLFLIIELTSVGFFYCLACSLGFFVAGLTAFFETSVLQQSVIGLSAFCLSFMVLQRLLKKYNFFLSKNSQRTNVYSLIGKQAIVVNSVSQLEMGHINVEGQLWAARSVDSKSIAPGTCVQIVGVKGCHAIIKCRDINHDTTLI